jgi:hypothetical protein
MTQPTALLLRANLKQLKLPTMLAECERLAREAAANNNMGDGQCKTLDVYAPRAYTGARHELPAGKA